MSNTPKAYISRGLLLSMYRIYKGSLVPRLTALACNHVHIIIFTYDHLKRIIIHKGESQGMRLV